MTTSRKPRMPAYRNLFGVSFFYDGVRVRVTPDGNFGLTIKKVVVGGREYTDFSQSYQSVRELIDYGLKERLYGISSSTVKVFEAWLKWAGANMEENRMDKTTLRMRVEEQWKRENGLPAQPDFQTPGASSTGKQKPAWRPASEVCAIAIREKRFPKNSELVCQAIHAGLTAEELELLDIAIASATSAQREAAMKVLEKVRFLESLSAV